LTGALTRDTYRLPKLLPEHGQQVHAAKDTDAFEGHAQLTVPNLAIATGFMAWRS
jgi:hypothetical protein